MSPSSPTVTDQAALPDLSLGLEQLGEIGPMTVAFDRSLTIRYLGPAWKNADPAAAIGQPLESRVRIVRPATPFNFDELLRRATSSTFLDVVATGLPLRGQFLRAGEDALIFFGKPWITSQADLERYGVTLRDLSLSDRDFLFVLQTKDVSIDDAARLAARLAAQRAEQRRTLQTLEAQFALTRMLASATTIEAGAAGLISALCDVAGWTCGAVWRLDRRQAQQLYCVDTWTRDDGAAAFLAATRKQPSVTGVGLVGRVWQSREAQADGDITVDPHRPRGAARAAGLQRAFAMPIGVGADLVGVVEIFGPPERPLDAQSLEVFGSMRSQISQFIERRRSEEALRVNEERTRLIIDSALDAVVTIDAQGIVQAWNTQAERTFGWTAADAIGRDLGELIVPVSMRASSWIGIVQHPGAQPGRSVGERIELTAVDRWGREFPVEVSISPVTRARAREGDPDGGAPILYSGFIRDITRRRESEEALRRAKEAAEAAAAAKSDFLATMSHEIRTPMNAVIGLTGLLLDTELSEGQRAYAETVRGAGESLLTIINDILDFSKVEAGQLELEHLPFSPAELVREIAELLGPSARAKNIALVVDVDPAVPPAVLSDPGRVRQVLTNLAANAVKFTERGEIRLRAEVMAADDEAVAMRFQVRDTGVGIDPTALPRLFKPFSQADSSMSRRYGGTGLGLAICDRLTRLLDGEITAESELGTGSCFTVQIPMPRASAESLDRSDARAETDAWVVPKQGQVRALVVEDNPANQMVALAMLRRLGVRADHVADGAEAVEAVFRQPYDFVLMDCQMPGMDGYAATRRIRSQEAEGDHVPIIALTANVLRGERERCLAAGMDDALAKPVRLEELARAMKRWVPALAEVAAPEPPPEPSPDSTLAERLAVVREAMGAMWDDACAMFISHSGGLLDQMRVAAAQGDGAELKRLAHSFRGGAEMMGGRACGAKAAEVERAVADDAAGASTWTPRVDALGAEFDRLVAAMRTLNGQAS